MMEHMDKKAPYKMDLKLEGSYSFNLPHKHSPSLPTDACQS